MDNNDYDELVTAYDEWETGVISAGKQFDRERTRYVFAQTEEQRVRLSQAMHRAYEAGMPATEIRAAVKAYGAKASNFKMLWEAAPGAPKIVRGRK